MTDKFKAPKDMEEAIHLFLSQMDEENKTILKDAKEHNNIVTVGDFFTGMRLRNSWGLWGKNDMTKYFNSIGITHPDDMSAMLMTSVHRRLNDKPIDIEGQVRFYQDYWKRCGYKDGKPK